VPAAPLGCYAYDNRMLTSTYTFKHHKYNQTEVQPTNSNYVTHAHTVLHVYQLIDPPPWLQRVVPNGIGSHWSDVTSGVPQGSVLGSLLFVLYINDITEVIQLDLGIFADDTKIFSIIRDTCDVTNFQRDLNNMLEWNKCWLLNLNLSKCKVMHLGRNPGTTYTIGINCGVDYDKLRKRSRLMAI